MDFYTLVSVKTNHPAAPARNQGISFYPSSFLPTCHPKNQQALSQPLFYLSWWEKINGGPTPSLSPSSLVPCWPPKWCLNLNCDHVPLLLIALLWLASNWQPFPSHFSPLPYIHPVPTGRLDYRCKQATARALVASQRDLSLIYEDTEIILQLHEQCVTLWQLHTVGSRRQMLADYYNWGKEDLDSSSTVRKEEKNESVGQVSTGQYQKKKNKKKKKENHEMQVARKCIGKVM